MKQFLKKTIPFFLGLGAILVALTAFIIYVEKYGTPKGFRTYYDLQMQ